MNENVAALQPSAEGRLWRLRTLVGVGCLSAALLATGCTISKVPIEGNRQVSPNPDQEDPGANPESGQAQTGKQDCELTHARVGIGPHRGAKRVWVQDGYKCYKSPWFKGSHPVTIPFGPTNAPYYKDGVHHGVDVDMPTGTAVYMGLRPKTSLLSRKIEGMRLVKHMVLKPYAYVALHLG